MILPSTYFFFHGDCWYDIFFVYIHMYISGWGLFALRKFRKGEIVCRYTGTRLSLAKLLKAKDTTYVMGTSLACAFECEDIVVKCTGTQV